MLANWSLIEMRNIAAYSLCGESKFPSFLEVDLRCYVVKFIDWLRSQNDSNTFLRPGLLFVIRELTGFLLRANLFAHFKIKKDYHDGYGTCKW
jgi:hypothetical protein